MGNPCNDDNANTHRPRITYKSAPDQSPEREIDKKGRARARGCFPPPAHFVVRDDNSSFDEIQAGEEFNDVVFGGSEGASAEAQDGVGHVERFELVPSHRPLEFRL